MREPDPVTPLWRAAQVFRLLSCIYALGFQIAINQELDHPTIGWSLFAVLVGWSVACAIAYLQGFGRRPAWVLAEIVVVVALVLSTEFIASDQWALDNQSWPTTLWATNATISAAILMGPIPGMLTGVVVMIASTVVKGFVNYDLGRNATIVIELAVGLAVGLAAQTARRAHAELERATRLAASLEERDRLSRQVHDGAIQVLALVARRGREIGGETAELAELAGVQERALRRLVSSADAEPRTGSDGRRRGAAAAASDGSSSPSACPRTRCCWKQASPTSCIRRRPMRSTTSRHTQGPTPVPMYCWRISATRSP